jgi:hypothetical protein
VVSAWAAEASRAVATSVTARMNSLLLDKH